MLDIMNRYSHGYVAIPVILACREKGLFTLLQTKNPLSLSQLVDELSANEGHLQVVLRMFESLQWVKFNDQGLIELTMDAKTYQLIQSLPIEVLSLYKIPVSRLLKSIFHRKHINRWIKYLLSQSSPNHLVFDFLQGTIIVPLLIALRQGKDSDLNPTYLFDQLSAKVRQTILLFFESKNWLKKQDGRIELTEIGKFMLDRSYNLATVASYYPMLAQISKILFGDPQKVFRRDRHGHELHIDRTLNVIASGFQHERYFKDIEILIISIFNREPYEEQPKYVIDMGCGDGTLLKRIYQTIVTQTKRGRLLDKYPLIMIGVDFNQKALAATQKTLSDIPHYTLQGNINDPELLLKDLKSSGISDPENALHIRSFLDHDRPVPDLTQQDKLGSRSRIPYQGVYVDKNGGALAPAVVVQNLVEHLGRWASIISKHGIIILEVHNLLPQTVATYFDQNESFHFDAFHAFSMQFLVEAEVFLLSAAEAGLFSKREFTKRYPEILPYTRISLNYFQKKHYIIRLAQLDDLPALIQLERSCSPEVLCTSTVELQQRLRRYIQGQFVVEQAGEIIGVVYTQRLDNVESLKRSSIHQVAGLHTTHGTIVQLLGIYVSPEWQDQGLGDQLLEFVLQFSLIKGDIEKVVGVTRCQNYKDHPELSLSEYIQIHEQNPRGVDPILRFHTSHGAQITGILPNWRPEDSDNRGNGILIEYAIKTRNFIYNETGQQFTPKQFDKPIVKDKVYTVIMDLLPKKNQALFSPDLSLREMGFDSLGLLELRLLLNQRFQIELEPTFFFTYSTPLSIAQYFQTQMNSAKGSGSANHHENTRASIVENRTHHDESDEAIAIIGIAAYLPSAKTLDDFWENLKSGHCAIREVSSSRWSIENYFSPDSELTGKTYSKWGGFLDEVDRFDAGFFRITPAEAEQMDPQQRLFLEVSWKALEDAGYTSSLDGSRCGVYAGVMNNDYREIVQRAGTSDTAPELKLLGNANSILAARIAYFLNLKGPVVTIDTACSSSLVATHLACQALQRKEADLMLVGGVTLYLTETPYIEMCSAGMLSKEGLCKPFDNSADGFVPAEGCAVIILKRLPDAIKMGDRIYGIIHGSGINQDGMTNGITAPSLESQKDLEISVYTKNHIHPEDITYVEAHGTGTKLGDPIELKALTDAFKAFTGRQQYCALGSVKGNIGHTSAAAGIASVIKVLLQLKHKQLVPSIHFHKPNEHIDFVNSPFYVNTQLKAWESSNSKSRLAAISSFGFSGTNSHVVIGEAPEQILSPLQSKPFYLITLSAKHPDSLHQQKEELRRWIKKNPNTPLEAIAYTLNLGRTHFNYRCAWVVGSLEGLESKLNQNQTYQKSEQEGQAVDDEILSYLFEKLKITVTENAEQYHQHLLHLADLYIKGYDLNWQLLHAGESHQKISLPTYSFLKKRYWYDSYQKAEVPSMS